MAVIIYNMEHVWKILKSFSLKRSNKCIEQYATILPPPSGGVLNFDSGKSVALCYGIDQQYHHHYYDASLGKTVKNDAEEMGEALRTQMGLKYIQVFTASSNYNDCTKAGISNLFIKNAEKVQNGGIFIFYFAGHGCFIKNSNKCILVPADFAGIEDLNTGISGNELIEWLHVAGCNASHVLFIFDCCYAGHLGKTLTFDNTLRINPSLFVMCGCAAGETCTAFDELEHSCFAYFLLDYLKTNSFVGVSVQFDVKQAMEKITELCSSFSSLYVIYNQGELEYQEMTPKLFKKITQRCVPVVPKEDVLISLLEPFFENSQHKVQSHPEVEKWLKSTNVKRSLDVLYPKASSYTALQKGIVSVMFCSSCSIQYAHDKSNLNRRNLFLTIAIKISHAINFGNLTLDYLIIGLENYISAIEDDIDKSDLWLLHKQFEDSSSRVPNQGGDFVTSHMRTRVCSYSACPFTVCYSF